jgi:hypothetical protein
MLDVPAELVLYVAKLLDCHRREIGTRRGTRALTCQKQAVFALAWFRDRLVSSGSAKRPGSPRPPPTATSTRPSACSPRRHRTCARPWKGRKPSGCRPDPGRRGRRRRPAEGKDHQQERQGNRPLVFRQGPRLRGEHPGPVHPRRHPAMGLPGPARRHPRHHRRPRARTRHLAALSEEPAGTGRFRVRRSRPRRPRPGEEAGGRRGT